MAGFLIDPKVVAAFLDKPYDLKAVWDTVAAPAAGPAPAAGSFAYTEAEKQYVLTEAERLYAAQDAAVRRGTRDGKHLALSAGGPGAGKSTLLENLLAEDNSFLHDMIFADPDERALKLMTAFIADIDGFGGGTTGLALSYTKWRWASNYVSGAIMNRACAEGHDILHGTTAASPQVSLLYDNAHAEGYDVTTILVAAPADVRTQSAERRFAVEHTRYTADTAEKGRMFYDRLPLLLQKTDHFRLFWRDAVQGDAVLAAEGQNGAVAVRDAGALSQLEADCMAVNPALAWDDLKRHYGMAP